MLNRIGTARIGAWAAVWSEGDQYVEIYPGKFFDANETAIRDGHTLGTGYTGSVEALDAADVCDTSPDVDGVMRAYSGDLDDYVTGTLAAWVATQGDTFAATHGIEN